MPIGYAKKIKGTNKYDLINQNIRSNIDEELKKPFRASNAKIYFY